MSDERTRTLQLPKARRGAPTPSLRVVITAGPDQGATFEIAKPRAIVGRAEGSDVRLSDPTVSQFHVELEPTREGVRLKDLDSHNGTYVGEVRVEEGQMPFGSELVVGATRARIERAEDFVAEESGASSFGGLVGASKPMREVYALLERLAKTDLSVLLEGPTGTGKDVAARALHEAGARSGGPFVTLDCTAIPPTLAESVLFGHEKGAFTGATERRIGMLEAASSGTIFFDELGELPLDLQPKLLRVLERREVVPVGGTKPRPIDVRVVSATLRDLRSMVNRHAFREDLYFRIAQTRVRLPALHERAEDVKPLVQFFIAGLSSRVKAARAIANDALDAMAAREYSGNVRELKNTVERLAMLAAGPTITLADLTFDRMIDGARGGRRRGDVAPSDSTPIEPFKEAKRTVIDEFEKGYVARLLARTGTNVSRAASLAGIERQSLRDLLKKHGLGGED